MSTFVPVEAKGGITLHPGPGPFAAGPGPFPARAMFSSSADAVAEKRVIAAAVAEISTEPARFNALFNFALLLPGDTVAPGNVCAAERDILRSIMTFTSEAEVQPVDRC
jgi:hypothetical protein